MMKKSHVVKSHKPLTSLFVNKDVRSALNSLIKSIKEKYNTYPADSVKRSRLKTFSVEMWNSLQDEFYHTADICINSVWSWQDKFSVFDEYGYLQFDFEPSELSDWASFVKGLYHREWAVEILKLIQEFNLDNREPVYVKAFKDDFKSVKNEEQFCSVVLKWTDLIRWSPWKLALLDQSFEQPRNVHYEDDFNPEVEDIEDAKYEDIFV